MNRANQSFAIFLSNSSNSMQQIEMNTIK